jgi:hypothetical protein
MRSDSSIEKMDPVSGPEIATILGFIWREIVVDRGARRNSESLADLTRPAWKRLDTPERTTDYITCIAKERVFTGEIPSEGIIGVLLHPLRPDEAITPDNFAANSEFVDLIQEMIARRGPGYRI